MSSDKSNSSLKRPNRRPLCYYGDDFTGSTDVLESLFKAGLSTVLFLEPPSAELLEERFQEVDCFGVAGVGRSMSPEEMERELRPIFETLKASGAAVVHYKVCSTFDSSPGIGSIGKAAEIGREVFGGRFIPLLAGVPYLRRYTLFGNHFAAGGEKVHRLDRHPTMSKHPVTPMAEADLRKHLEQQTLLTTSLIDIMALDGTTDAVRERLELVIHNEQPDMVLFDVLDEARLETAGRMIWDEAIDSDGLFVIGSSGVEYALSAAWRSIGLLNNSVESTEDENSIPSESIIIGAPAAVEAAKEVKQLLVVSGSCSPVTEKQIQKAIENGYAGIRVPVSELLQSETSKAARLQLKKDAAARLANGQSVILYSAAGPNDESINQIRDLLSEQGLRAEESSRLLGMILGSLTKELVEERELTRVLIAGGDTSGYVTRELGIYALACKAALDPGGPLCRAFSKDHRFDGLELVLKGGQVGSDNFFEKVRLGQ